MQWYILTQTTDRSVIGKAPSQSDAKNLLSTAIYLYEPAPLYLMAPRFKLHHHAKLTDWVQTLSHSDLHPLVSQKLLDCLNTFKTVHTSRAVPTKLIGKKGEELPYYLFVQHADFTATDFERSVFCKYVLDEESGQWVHKDMTEKVSTYQEVRDYGGISARVLYIKENIEWDFFVLGGPPFLFLARDHVVEALQAANITGICYVPFKQGDDFAFDDIFMKTMRIEQPDWGGLPENQNPSNTPNIL